jgi:uncharacterized protein (DUF58 family)
LVELLAGGDELVLTDRGRFALALGGVAYLAGWAFGSDVLFPVALGLVLAVVAAVGWVRLTATPVRLRRTVRGGEHVAGDDVPVRVTLEVEGRLAPRSLTMRERIERLGEREVVLRAAGRTLRGEYTLTRVPRGRYAIEASALAIEDPFGLERRDVSIHAAGALLVYPRLVELERLFSETGSRLHEGRRLLLRRPSGFDLHSVREYEQGESLRRVHWPSTAKRGQLMVKDLEDSPRDEALVLLDADASFAVGEPPDSSFEVAVSAAGSILKAHAGRGRRAGLVINGLEPRYQQVHTLDGDWGLALELLASALPNGRTPVAAQLVDGAGMPAKALELCVVTSGLTARLADRILQRAVTRRATSIVYVDPASFATPAGETPAEARVQLARLAHAGIPVAAVRLGDDLAAALSASDAGARPSRRVAAAGRRREGAAVG